MAPLYSPLHQQLDRVARLAGGSRWQRLWHQPFRYLYATLFQSFVYPVFKKGILKQTTTFFGTNMQVLLPAGTDIYLTGGKSHNSEIRLARFLIKRVQPGDTVLDIGAHFGYFTNLLATLTGPTGQVFALEAAQNTFQILQKNTQQAENIHLLHRAVAQKSGEIITFFEFPVLFSEYNTTDVHQFEDQWWYRSFPPRHTEVETLSLDDLTEIYQIIPAFVKIDVEGAEDQAIAGFTKNLQLHRPHVIMEYVEPKRHNKTHQKAHIMLLERGYRAFVIDSDGTLIPCENPDSFLEEQKMESDNIVYVQQG
jgi:FkbM family methyltransferase